jgi:hypothetical protein
MRIIVKLDGVTGLVMHNERLADPDDEYVRAIKELTAKKGNTRTDADNAEIAKLEWFGGVYHDPDAGLYIPTWNVIRCFEQAGKITKKGTAVIRALSAVSDKVPLQYDGPRDLAKLWAMPEYRLRKMVGVKGGRVPRMRPIFRRWSIEMEAEFMEDVLNPAEFERIAEQAGRSEGLCNARKLGYGRFQATVIR